jgi:TolB-like protein/DNA-binding winged helix-turn-helix (wHTH) protein/cytochrome c-type biogenesis protein CcmH/NrfG
MSQPSQQNKNNTDPRFRVDDLEVDTGKAVVTRNGVELPLPKLSFDLLRALIESAPSIATTDSLLNRVWPGLVVNPETVAARVKLLRDVIGDDPKRPRYILAVRARGYRLIPPVERLLDSRPVEQSPPPSSAEHVHPSFAAGADIGSASKFPSRTRTFTVLAIAGFALLAALAAGLVMVRMHAAPPRGAAETPHVAVEKAALPARTVAVLPFASLGGQPADESVAAGFAESIRLRLGSLSQVIVIASHSSAAYNGKNVNATTIGQELNARYLLEGTLQRQNDSMRITAHLVDADSGQDVWSVAFDRKTSDIFSIEDEISARVAHALRVTLDARDLERSANPGTANLDAYLEYLQARGLSHLNALKWPDVQSAIEHYQRAIELDPNFSAAYSGLAEVKISAQDFGDFDRSKRKSVQADVRQLTAKALQFDGRNAEAYRAMADVEDDPTRRGIYNRHAVALEPNSAPAHNTLAEDIALPQAGTSPSAVDEALFHLDKAMEIDPLDADYPVNKAVTLLFQRPTEIAQVEPLLLRALDHDPANVALMWLALLHFTQDREADAAKLMEQAFFQSQDPKSVIFISFLAHIYVSVGDVTAAENLVARSKNRGLRVITLVARREWQAAALLVYQDPDFISPGSWDILPTVFAVRMAAHQDHQLARARKLLEDYARVGWDTHGLPITQVPMSSDMTLAVGLADILQLSGETERARKVLEMSLSSMDTAAFKFKRGNFWFWLQRSRVMAMLGRNEESLAALEHVTDSAEAGCWTEVDLDPAFDHLRLEPRFQGFLSERKRHTAEQLALLQQMREKGEIPSRASK